MKKIQKIASLLLAMVMALALAAPAFAADDYSITINDAKEGQVFEAYQIFDGDLAEDGKTLSNIKWGSGIKLEDGADPATAEIDGKTAAEWAKYLEEETTQSVDDPKAVAFASMISAYLADSTTLSATVAEDATSCTITITDPGYYLVRNAKDGVGANEGYTRYILQVLGAVEVKSKADTTRSDKNISGTGKNDDSITEVEPKNYKGVDVSIGDTVEFTLTATLPSNYNYYESFTLVFHDVMSKGLTFGEIKEVKVVRTVEDKETTVATITERTDNAALAGYDKVTTTVEATGETKLDVTIENLMKNGTFQAGDVVTVVYTATLNENAKIGTVEGNPNKLTVDFSNDPNNSGTGDNGKPDPKNPHGTTPESEVKVYTTELQVTKVDENEEFLTGAEFTLTGESVNVVLVSKEGFVEDPNGKYWLLKDGTYTTDDPATEGMDQDAYASIETKYAKTTVVETVESTSGVGVAVSGYVDENGIVKFTGLGAGDYTLSESVTPDGYNTIKDITFTITFDPTGPAFNVEKVSEPAKITVVEGTTTLATTIVNESGTLLPSTGGIGTTIFYVVGGVLAAGAVILLITKRRMNIEK